MSASPDHLQELFHLEVLHNHCDGAICPSVKLVPVEPPAARLAHLGLVFRGAENGAGWLTAYRSADGADADLPFDLVFEIVATEKDFFAYTDLGGSEADTTLWFDSPQATPETDDRVYRLHAGAVVSAADRLPCDGLPVLHTVMQRPSPGRVGFVRMRLQPGDAPFKIGRITFDARATIWAYVLLGATRDPISIRDAQGQVMFEPAVPTTLPGGRSALVVRSKTALPLTSRARHHFDLIEASPNGERVLIKHLPSAPPSAWALETIDGVEVAVSQILIELER